jgi:hypothetical protein
MQGYNITDQYMDKNIPRREFLLTPEAFKVTSLILYVLEEK